MMVQQHPFIRSKVTARNKPLTAFFSRAEPENLASQLPLPEKELIPLETSQHAAGNAQQCQPATHNGPTCHEAQQ